jgi:uncharacterized protein YukE
MGHLDVNASQLLTSQSSFEDKASLMRSTMASAEQSAVAAQAFHTGDSALAFQTAHAHFIEAAAKINSLLDIASAQLGEGGTTYLTEDAAAAASYHTGSV